MKRSKTFCHSKIPKFISDGLPKISVKAETSTRSILLDESKTDPKFAGDNSWNFNKFLIDRKGKYPAAFFIKGIRPKVKGDLSNRKIFVRKIKQSIVFISSCIYRRYFGDASLFLLLNFCRH